jgi:hypothetical protein
MRTRGSRVAWALASLWLVVLGSGACGHAPKPAGSVASIEVQYEDNPAAAKAKAKEAEEPPYWQNRKDLIAAPAPPQAAPLALPSVVRWKLKNGLDVIVVPRKDLPVVSVGFAIKAGNYDEDKAQSLGVADFTAAMLRRGTSGGAGKNDSKKARSADDISSAIDFVGGALDAQASLESSTGICSVLSRDLGLCVDLIADVLQRPSFPDK